MPMIYKCFIALVLSYGLITVGLYLNRSTKDSGPIVIECPGCTVGKNFKIIARY